MGRAWRRYRAWRSYEHHRWQHLAIAFPLIERRANKFPERLSFYVVIIAAIGAFFVLLDPMITIHIGEHSVKFGGDGFSSELKGAVITIMLIGGWQGVMGFWLGQSDSGQRQAQSMSRIAEQAAPVLPAAQTTAPIVTDNVTVDANTATINSGDKS